MAAVERPAYPSDDALRDAASAIERRLALQGAADPFQELSSRLDPPTSAARRPSPAATAEYCAAAGELMRVSPQGSQLQAQTYLLSAFRGARGPGLEGTASVAAYRLGLVSLSGPTVAGARGGRATRGGATAAVRNAATVEGAGPCDVL